jgi:hypothetical protein
MPGLPTNADASGALATAASAGPYFTIEPWAEGQGWRPANLLISDPTVLADRVTYVRAAIAGRAGIAPAEVSDRVAASTVFLGLASRLVSPSLSAAALSDVVPYLTLDNLWWRPVNGGPVPPAAGPTAGREIGGAETGRQLDDAAAMLSKHCVQGMASPVAGAFQGLFRLSPLVLRGTSRPRWRAPLECWPRASRIGPKRPLS